MAEEAQNEEVVEEEKNPLDMSDEEILNMEPADFGKEEVTEEEEQEPVEKLNEEPVEPVQAKEQTFSDEGGEEVEVKTEEEPSNEEEPTSKDESLEKTSEIDYKAEYEKLLAPFKAAGQEINVQSVDEAIRLMQQGVDYNKKTATIKDLKRKIQPLEDNNLLTDANISLFIDLVAKKDQNALKKIIGDFGIDPLDIDTNDSSEYKPNTYTVDEARLELDEVLDELKDSTHYTNILDVIGNRWDEKSKQMVADKPSIMRDMNQHMTSGVYDVVMAEVERQKVFGSLNGLSDIEAYNAVGSQLAQQGKLQEYGVTPPPPMQQAPAAPAPQPVQQTMQTNPELNQKRKAAGTTKSMPSGQTAPKPNPLGMSDEDFLKQGF